MNFIAHKYALTGFDGRCILRLIIHRPDDDSAPAARFLTYYSQKCEEFARERLYPALQNDYLAQYNVGNRYGVLTYILNISETFFDGKYASYLIVARLSSNNATKAIGIDSVIFCENKIMPERLLSKKCKKGQSYLILDKNGFLSSVSVLNNELSINKLGKRKFSE